MSIRVLHVLNNLGSGGAEAFIMNVYRAIDRTAVQFDFLIRSKNNGPFIEEIKEMGGRVFILPSFPRHFLSNHRALRSFLSDHAREYAAIHVHANALIYVRPLQLAKKYRIPIRIIHSHNTSSSFPWLHRLNIARIDRWVTARFACSDLAGAWMFPNRQYELIPNGIDPDRFSFSVSARNEIRKSLDIEQKKVIGHVGRFSEQKNHPFLIDVFEKYHALHPETVLLLVGEGERRSRIEALVRDRGLSDAVFFTGAVSDVWRYLSAMDVFCFPSLYEGFGIVLIEAQQNGLPCVISDAVPADVLLNPNVKALSLQADISDWIQNLSILSRCEEEQYSPRLQRYNNRTVAKEMEQMYLSRSRDWSMKCPK